MILYSVCSTGLTFPPLRQLSVKRFGRDAEIVRQQMPGALGGKAPSADSPSIKPVANPAHGEDFCAHTRGLDFTRKVLREIAENSRVGKAVENWFNRDDFHLRSGQRERVAMVAAGQKGRLRNDCACVSALQQQPLTLFGHAFEAIASIADDITCAHPLFSAKERFSSAQAALLRRQGCEEIKEG